MELNADLQKLERDLQKTLLEEDSKVKVRRKVKFEEEEEEVTPFQIVKIKRHIKPERVEVVVPTPVAQPKMDSKLTNAGLALDYMQQLTGQPIYQNMEILLGERLSIYISNTYTMHRRTLKQLQERLRVVSRYVAELRSHMHFALKFIVKPVHETHDLENLLESWLEFNRVLEPSLLRSMHNPSRLIRFDEATLIDLKDYFLGFEQIVMRMNESISVADERLHQTFREWQENFRNSFAVRLSKQCASQTPCELACFWKDSQCREKPFLTVIEDFIKAFCGVDKLGSNENTQMLKYVDTVIGEINQKWFGRNDADYTKTPTELCERILGRYRVIAETLRREIGGESIPWNHAGEIMALPKAVWESLWTTNPIDRKAAIEVLKRYSGGEKLTLYQETMRYIWSIMLFQPKA